MEWGWREVSSILRRGKSPAVRPGWCWLLPAPGEGAEQSQGVRMLSSQGGFCGGELIPEAAAGGFCRLVRGRQPQRGEGWCPRGCEGSGQEWTRSFLDELVDPASPMADKNRAFPRNPLLPVFLHAQASLSFSKPPRAAGACFSRIFQHRASPLHLQGDAPRMGYTSPLRLR